MRLRINNMGERERVALYSTFFLEPRLPRHILVVSHITGFYVEEWLLQLLRSGAAEAAGPPFPPG